MKVKLWFDTWQDKNGKDIYCTEKGIDLSMGDFHGGTIFKGTIECPYGEEELQQALKDGYMPVFKILPEEE